MEERRESYLEISDVMASSWATVARRMEEAAEEPRTWLEEPNPRSIVLFLLYVGLLFALFEMKMPAIVRTNDETRTLRIKFFTIGRCH